MNSKLSLRIALMLLAFLFILQFDSSLSLVLNETVDESNNSSSLAPGNQYSAESSPSNSSNPELLGTKISSTSESESKSSNQTSSQHPVPKISIPQLYCFGGKNDDTTLASVSHYNYSTRKWKRLASMTNPRAFFGAALFWDRIYITGGVNGESSASVESYDYLSKTTTSFGRMLFPRGACSATELDGNIYVAGGVGFDKWSYPVANYFERYNNKTKEWERLKDMNAERRGLKLVTLKGYIYAIGGTNTHSVERYNVTSNRWTMIPDTEFQHDYFGSTVHNDKIYVCSNQGFEVYDPEINEWETLTPLNDAWGRALASMGGKLWALGGGKNWVGSKTVHTYNFSTGNWTKEPDMNIARSGHTCVVIP